MTARYCVRVCLSPALAAGKRGRRRGLQIVADATQVCQQRGHVGYIFFQDGAVNVRAGYVVPGVYQRLIETEDALALRVGGRLEQAPDLHRTLLRRGYKVYPDLPLARPVCQPKAEIVAVERPFRSVAGGRQRVKRVLVVE